MKTNRRMNGGGKLRRSQYEVWAEVLAKYVDAYAREGVRISRMSVQNEPMAKPGVGFVPVQRGRGSSVRGSVSASGVGCVRGMAM